MVGLNVIGVAERHGHRLFFVAGIRPGGQRILAVEERLRGVVVDVVPAVESVLVAAHVIHAADHLPVRIVGGLSVEDKCRKDRWTPE